LRSALTLLGLLVAVAAASAPAGASARVLYGVQDDSWLVDGPGELSGRLKELRSLGVEAYRFTLRWDQVAARKPSVAADPGDAAYDWSWPDAVIRGLKAQGIKPVVTIWGTPPWANGGQTPNFVPSRPGPLASFSRAAAKRYRVEVRHWVVWNEPNQRRWMRPTTPRVYVGLLNAAYTEIKRADPTSSVAGGVTAPRGNVGGVNPVNWIRAMGSFGAKLDAYAHHPYPAKPGIETPWSGGCSWCKTITMADLDRLIREVQASFPGKRIWLTEYGYQTNPPEQWMGVTFERQALYASAAALRAYTAPYVDMLIHFMIQDDARLEGWQSGLRTLSGAAKPAYDAFKLPLAQVSRSGDGTAVWGQVRPRSGKQPYRLQQWRDGAWRWVGGRRFTDSRGFFQRAVQAVPGTQLRTWSPQDRLFSPPLTVR
jgi:hypothetical protein